MPTYTPLQSIQLASSSATVTFSNIPQNYQDLVLVLSVRGTTATNDIDVSAILNGDTSSIYSNTRIYGTGSAAGTQRGTGLAYLRLGNMAGSGSYNSYTPIILNIQNYSNATTFKTTLGRSNNPDRIIDGYVNLWRSTAAVTSVRLEASSNFDIGSTFDLYGISPVAAQNAQAFGGTEIYYDSSYVYHVFKGSGTFTPYRNLTADILTIAGGGSGGLQYGGGGGAGGVVYSASQSLISGTNYACVVGAGASTAVDSGSRDGSQGNNSQFGSLTAAVGGGLGGGDNGNVPRNGGNGGSGGGGSSTSSGNGNGGTATSGQGNNGAAGNSSSHFKGGGGGGAGEAGNTDGVGWGGDGTSAYSSWGLATGTGQNVGGTYFYAGGGGGALYFDAKALGGDGGGGNGGGGSSTQSQPTPGMTNTGGGGGAGWGGAGTITTSGGSGIIIVRYAR
jgi:hypothetical protein